MLATVGTCCHNLGSLYMEFESDSGVTGVSAEAILNLARGCPNLHVRDSHLSILPLSCLISSI